MNIHLQEESGFSVPPELIEGVRAARRIVVLTGAGMSAESGIPTFRDALTGLWSKFDPQTLATPEGFKRDPALVWGWYEARRRGVMRAVPNAGHLALHDLSTLHGIDDLTIVTQNVDDLHERAGSRQVIHLHGSLFAPRCLACGRPTEHVEQHAAGLEDDGSDRAIPPPRCQHCNGLVRPGVVWFGEDLPQQEWRQALERVREADLLLVVGTSGKVYPASRLPQIAENNGAPVWVINPDPDLDVGAWAVWNATAATALPALVVACIADKG